MDTNIEALKAAEDLKDLTVDPVQASTASGAGGALSSQNNTSQNNSGASGGAAGGNAGASGNNSAGEGAGAAGTSAGAAGGASGAGAAGAGGTGDGGASTAGGGGAAGGQSTTTKTEEQIAEEATTKMLAGLGVKTMDELKAKLAAPETPEQKLARETQYTAGLDKFAIDNALLTRDEIIALENTKKQSHEDRVFAEFKSEFLEKNPDKDEAAARENFRLFYNLDAGDEFLKAKGASALEEKSNSILSKYQSKYDSAKERFDAVQADKAKVPHYQAAIKSAVAEGAPAKLVLVSGEGDEQITFDVSDAERLAIEKDLVNDETFDLFSSTADAQQVKQQLKDKVETMVFMRNKDKILKAVKDAGYSLGLKNGSTTGASQQFPLNGGQDQSLEVKDEITAEDDASFREKRAGFR